MFKNHIWLSFFIFRITILISETDIFRVKWGLIIINYLFNINKDFFIYNLLTLFRDECFLLISKFSLNMSETWSEQIENESVDTILMVFSFFHQWACSTLLITHSINIIQLLTVFQVRLKMSDCMVFSV
jgi:hypothetical protein